MGFWRSITDWSEKHDPLFRMAKRGAYAVAKQDSDNMEGIGRAIGWDWLTEEAQRNQKNPGRAIGKAAATAATIYGGGLLGGAGAGGSAAGSAAGNAAVNSGNVAANAAMGAADYEAILAAQQLAAQQAAQQTATQGLLSAPQGFANTMEAGLTDTGYTPSTMLDAFKNGPGSGQGLLSSVGKWAGNVPKNMSAGDARLGLQGLQMMGGQEQQPMQPAPPPRPSQPPPQSSFTGYGDQPPPGVDPMQWAQLPEEIKQRIRQQATGRM